MDCGPDFEGVACTVCKSSRFVPLTPQTGRNWSSVSRGHRKFCMSLFLANHSPPNFTVYLPQNPALGPDVPPASAGSDMIRWSRVLLSHTLDAARSY